jgi:LysM repeat protein
MKTNRFWITVAGIVIAIMCVVGVGGAYFASKIPDVAQQLPSGATPIIVTLTTPLNGSTVQLNSPTSVEAQALGSAPIAALELWVDGVLMQTNTPLHGSISTRFITFWSWTPVTEGEHALIVRAIDATDNTAQSNVVSVTVSGEPEVINIPYEPQPGDTIDSVAEDTGIPAEDIAGANPDVSPDEPLPSDEPIILPVPQPIPEPPTEPPPPEQEPPSPPQGPLGDPPLNPPNKLIFWIIGNLLATPDPPPAPAIAASVEGCNVNLFVTDQADNESGFFVYRFGPGVSEFERIATLGKYDGQIPFQYTDEGLFGTFVYYVASFNAGGESSSNLYSVKVDDPACLTDEWSSLGLEDGKITVSEPVDKLYCYLSVDEGPWTRIPTGPGEFIYPDNGVFDVSAYLETLVSPPPPGGVTLGLECWGWQGGTLVYLGAAKQTIPSQNYVPIQISTGQLQLIGNILIGATQTYGGGGGLPDARLFQPQFLKATQNPQECIAHLPAGLAQLLGSLVCGEAIADGYTALVWEWTPGGCWPGATDCVAITDINGYNLYEVGSGYEPRVLVDTNTDPDTTVFAVPPQWPKTDGTLHCYVVRAYADTLAGMLESPDSNVACLTPTGLGVETIVLQPADMRTVTETYAPSCGGVTLHEGGLGGEDWNLGPDEILAGYDGGKPGECYVRHWYDGAVRFDLSQIGQASLQYATLKWQGGTSLYSFGWTATNQVLSCANQLSLADADWSALSDTHIPSTPYHPLELVTTWVYGEPFTQDVTTAVVFWRDNPTLNYGFVLSNTGPVLIPEDDGYWDACWTHYHDFELEVTYFPNP